MGVQTHSFELKGQFTQQKKHLSAPLFLFTFTKCVKKLMCMRSDKKGFTINCWMHLSDEKVGGTSEPPA